MSSLMHRFLRAAAFLAGLALGVGAAVFGYSNTGEVSIHWWRLSFEQVSIGWVAVVPLLVGVVAGYVYHLPARMHHFSEHMRHRHLVHELEKENKELQKSLDRLLEMPDDSVAPKALKAAPLPVLSEPESGSDLDETMIAEPVIVHEVRHAPARAHAGNGRGSNGHRGSAKAVTAVTAAASKPVPKAEAKRGPRRRATLDPKAADLPS